MTDQKNIPEVIISNVYNLHLPFSFGDVPTLIDIGNENPNSIILLIKLHEMAIVQGKRLIRCTKDMLKKELGWSHSKIKAAKRVLIKHGIVKNVTRRNNKNRIVFHALLILKIKENTTGLYLTPWNSVETVDKCVEAYENKVLQEEAEKGFHGVKYNPYNNITTLYSNTKEGVNKINPPSIKKNKSKRTKFPIQHILSTKYPLVKKRHIKFTKKVLNEIRLYYPYSCNDTSNQELIYRNADVLRKIENRSTAEFIANFKKALLWFPSSTHFWRDNLRCIATLLKTSGTTGVPKFEYLTSEYLKSNPVEEKIDRPVSEKELYILCRDFNVNTTKGSNKLQHGMLSIITMFHNIPEKVIKNNDIFNSRFPNGKVFLKEYIKYLKNEDWLTLTPALITTDHKLFNAYLKKVSEECMVNITRFNYAN